MEKQISFTDKCRQLNIDVHKARQYKRMHPELTDEQVLEYYITKKQSFRSLCEQYKVNYNTALGYRKRHPELTDVQVLEYFSCKKQKGCSFTDKLRQNNINISRGRNFKFAHKNLSNEEIINELLKEKEKTFKEKCEEYGINPMTVRYYIDKCDYKTEDELIQYAINTRNKNKQSSFKNKCKQAGVSYYAARNQKQKHPELTDEQIIKLCIQIKNTKTLKDICRENGLSYGRVIYYRDKYENLTIEEIIDIVKKLGNNIVYEKLYELCEKTKVNYRLASNYKRLHPELTDEQIILYYRPDCHINIFGDIVE